MYSAKEPSHIHHRAPDAADRFCSLWAGPLSRVIVDDVCSIASSEWATCVVINLVPCEKHDTKIRPPFQ